ncbi:hypothetical protein HOLleu_14488 [Holothuria leucospilota]|uniref:Uncharacterized protein n=1 Tax=Holothuria leucospilota TaxID=206669 RepID=A0A9Q1C8D8_HOLLE|nr:hypothetical protein HOLleu_14488 [Holothuria leucospilota]
MKRFVFLVAVFLVYSATVFGHHHDDDDDDDGDGDHHHEGSVEASLDENGKLTVLFHDEANEDFDSVRFSVEDGDYVGTQTNAVTHHDHEDWSYVFTVSGISVCDDVDIVVTGISDGNERVEFDGAVEIPDPNGNCS